MDILSKLFLLQDTGYRDFHKKLFPTLSQDVFIGVRTADLRAMAKEIAKNKEVKEKFLSKLPHLYFEENQLHIFILSQEKDFSICIDGVETFLPFIDNWATCDQLSPKIFRKHKEELFVYIKRWMDSNHSYTIRFGIGMLMEHYLGTDFSEEYHEMVLRIISDEYYVRMMVAWYFATALFKQREATISILEENRLDVWTHNKTIQKAIESNRISLEEKVYLRTLKRKLK